MNSTVKIKSIFASRWIWVATFVAAVLIGFCASYAWASIVCTGGVCNGTNGPDTMIGSSGPDTISGLDGNDEVYGNDGNDIVRGNGGADPWVGGNDDVDDVYGGPGNDPEVHGGPGDDRELLNRGVYGGSGNDFVYGDGGYDTLTGDEGKDNLDGGAENNGLHADDGEQDWLYGGAGTNNYCWYDSALDYRLRCDVNFPS